MRSSLRVLAVALTACLGLPAAAHASGGLLVSPSSVDTAARAGKRLPAIRVTNGTGRALVLHASTRVAQQELSGLPVYGDTRAARRAGRSFVRISPARFSLAPGASRLLHPRVVAAHPQVGRGGYGVVVVDAVPRRATGARNAITSRLRLTANLLLTYPSAAHPPRVKGVAVGLRAEQASARTLRLLVRVHGAGTIHGRPLARLRIRDVGGRVVDRARFPTGNVLPGADRELPVLLTRVLPAGDYTARAVVLSGGHKSWATLHLHLVGPNELPTPDLRIARLAAPHPAAGKAFHTDLQLINRGTAPARAAGWWALRTIGGAPVAHGRMALPPVAAGSTSARRLDFPAVRAGRWRLTVGVTVPGRELDRREVVFATGVHQAWWPRFEDWASGHVALLLALCGSLVLLVLVAAAAYTRRLRRRLAHAGQAR